MQIKLSKPMSVASARAALIAAGGAIVDGYIDVPTPEAAIAGLDYLAAVHRQRQDEIELEESRRFQLRYLDSLIERH